MQSIDAQGARGNPMGHRSCLVVFLMAASAAVVHAEPITEGHVIERASQLAEVAASEAEAQAAEAAVLDARAWPNPALTWDREHVSGSTQDIVAVEVPVPLGPRWRTRTAV